MLTVNDSFHLSRSDGNKGSTVVVFRLAIRIASVKRLCGRRIKVRHLGWPSGRGRLITGVRGRMAVATLCKWDTIERGQGSEHKGSDSSLAIDQIASEDDGWRLIHSMTYCF